MAKPKPRNRDRSGEFLLKMTDEEREMLRYIAQSTANRLGIEVYQTTILRHLIRAEYARIKAKGRTT